MVGEFEEPPTVESLEKRVVALENKSSTSVKFIYGYVPPLTSFLYESAVKSNYEKELEIRKAKARDKALAELDARNKESVAKYQAEKKRIEEMK